MYFPALNRVVHRGTTAGAAVILPAAGAETALADGSYPALTQWQKSAGPMNGALLVPDGIYSVTFWCTYTRAAGQAGAVAVGMMVSNGVEQAREPVIDSTITVTSGFGRQNVYSRDLTPLPAPSSDAAVTYPPITFDVKPGWYVWLQAAEVGVPASPGTLLVALTGAPS